MNSRPADAVPLPRSVGIALAANDTLADLARRMRESQQRFEAIAPLLPAALVQELRPGPIDDEGWSVLASNAAVAAKLRQWLPRLDDELRSRGLRDLPIRVRLRMPL